MVMLRNCLLPNSAELYMRYTFFKRILVFVFQFLKYESREWFKCLSPGADHKLGHDEISVDT